jgi:hypothetical protein
VGVDTIWAQALALAGWWLLWGGFGEHAWRAEGISRRNVLILLGGIWLLGWVTLPIPVAGASVPLNLGWATMTAATGLGGLAVTRGRIAVIWAVLGSIALVMRMVAPIAPDQASVVPWLLPEAVVLGLAGAVAGGDPVRGALAASGGGALAALLSVAAHPWGASLGAPQWLYTVATVHVAWLAGTVAAPVLRRRWL